MKKIQKLVAGRAIGWQRQSASAISHVASHAYVSQNPAIQADFY